MSGPADDMKVGMIPTLDDNVVSLADARDCAEARVSLAQIAYALGKQAAMEEYERMIRNRL